MGGFYIGDGGASTTCPKRPTTVLGAAYATIWIAKRSITNRMNRSLKRNPRRPFTPLILSWKIIPYIR
jgi:hypothetical protein